MMKIYDLKIIYKPKIHNKIKMIINNFIKITM